MTIFHRRILYLSFTVLFLIVAPLLLLYAEGFRIDVRHQLVYKTGLFALTVSPQPDTITIDTVRRTRTSTAIRIPGLAPGTHTVTVSKNGYHSWTGTVLIRSGTATTYDDIILIRDEEPSVVAKNVDRMVPSPDKKTMLLLHTNNQLSLFHLDTDAEISLPAFAETPNTVTWSPSSTAVIITTNEGNAWLWQQGATAYQAMTNFPRNASKVLWDTQHPESVYVIDQQNLYSVQWRAGTSSLLEHGVLDIAVQNGQALVLTTNTTGTTTLERLSLDGNKKVVTTFPSSAAARLLENDGHESVVLDSNNQTLSIFTNQPTQTFTLSPATFASWDETGSALVYGNEFEVTTANNPGQNMTTQLLTRTSGTITNAFWLASMKGIVVQEKQGLLLYENIGLHTGDPIPLFSTTLSDLFLDGSGVVLYAQTPEGTVLRRRL